MNDNITYRRGQLAPPIFSSPGSIELNVSETCTRQCSFCPRSNGYPNKSNFMSRETAVYIASHLDDINYTGRVGLSGFGEPLCHPDLWYICFLLYNGTRSLELITNGDLLTKDKVIKLFRMGIDKFIVNLYDDDADENKIIEMFDEWDLNCLRIRRTKDLILNNRAGSLDIECSGNEKECYLPFYKLMIDWNGDYMMCSNDWNRSKILPSVKDISIKDYWTENLELTNLRKNLIKGERIKTPCTNCNCTGTLVGESYFNYWKEKYER